MKTALCFLCLLGVACGEPDSETEKPKAVRAAISATLKREFIFELKRSADRPVTDTEVTVLPPFEVTGAKQKESIYRAITDEMKKKEEAKPSWTKGGTFLTRGNMTVMFKYDPDKHGFNILNFAF